MSKLSFDEVRHDGHTAAHARCATPKHIGKEIFKPGTHSPAVPLRACVGDSQTAPFHTLSPHGAAKTLRARRALARVRKVRLLVTN